MVKLYMFFLSLETSTVAFRTVLDELLCFFFSPEFDILSIFFQESFVFAFSFAFQRKFAPEIPAKFPRNRPFSLRICLFKSRKISLFSPRIIRSPGTMAFIYYQIITTSIKERRIKVWISFFIAVGDTVAEDEVVGEIETDKVH